MSVKSELLATFPQVIVSNNTKKNTVENILNLTKSSEHLNFYLSFLNVTNNVLKYYSIGIIILGTLFNCLNFACFYRMKKRNSQNVYLSALSLADLLNVQVNILLPVIKNIKSENKNESKLLHQSFDTLFITESNQWNHLLCILDGYLVEVTLLLPVWIMVILATERFLCIMWPLHKNVFCTPRKAKIILMTLVSIVLSWCLFKIGTAGVENDSTFKIHPKDESCRNIEYPTLVNISTAMWAIVPGICCLILNILIIKKIKLTTNPHKQFYPSERCRKINQTTRVVIALSIIFVILISPTGILIILDNIINKSGKNLSIEKTQMAIRFKIARKYALLLYEVNIIINFPVYLLTIKNFRYFKVTLDNLNLILF